MSIITRPRPEPADDVPAPSALPPTSLPSASADGRRPQTVIAGCPRCLSGRPDVRRVVDTSDNGTHVVRVVCSDEWHGGIDRTIRAR